MCEGPILESTKMSIDEEIIAATHSPESIWHVVPMVMVFVVARVFLPRPWDMFAIKLFEFLTNLDSTKSKMVGCLLKEKE